VESSLNSPHSRASFLAACIQHSGDRLFALPIAACGMQLDDEAVRVAVGLRLGLDLCSPHECRCGSVVDARGLHSYVCKKTSCKTIRHLMTWLLVAFQQLAFKSSRNLQTYLVPTGNAPMDFPSFPAKTAKRFAGMWQSSAVSRLIHFQLLLVMPGRQGSEIRGFRWSIYVCSHCLRELGSTKRFNSPAFFIPWPKNDWHSGESRETSYLFQRCSVLKFKI